MGDGGHVCVRACVYVCVRVLASVLGAPGVCRRARARSCAGLFACVRALVCLVRCVCVRVRMDVHAFADVGMLVPVWLYARVDATGVGCACLPNGCTCARCRACVCGPCGCTSGCVRACCVVSVCVRMPVCMRAFGLGCAVGRVCVLLVLARARVSQ